jgi:hypothetical protein
MTNNAAVTVNRAPLGNPGMFKNVSVLPLQKLSTDAQLANTYAKGSHSSKYVVPAQVVTQSGTESFERELLAVMYGAWAPVQLRALRPNARASPSQ